MAAVTRAHFGWVGPGTYLAPGGAHNWWMTGFKYGDVLSVTAQSVGGHPAFPQAHGVLMVDNVRVDRPPSEGGPTLLFRVNNVGGTPLPAYGVGVAWISA